MSRAPVDKQVKLAESDEKYSLGDPEKHGSPQSSEVAANESAQAQSPPSCDDRARRNIGTGLFVGSGGALAKGGPVGILLGYPCLVHMGMVVYSVMIALGEMATLFPVSGGFMHYASRFIDPAVGFALGVNYWYCWGIALPVELTAAGIVIQYWNTSINIAVWVTIQYVLILIINFMGVRWYGEFEFWFSAIKITAIVGLIILGVAINCGAGPASTGYIGFKYWVDPGPFNQVATHGGASFVPGAWGAAFSFIGTEIVAVTVGEAENPRRNIPKAIRRVFWRIIIFYVVGILIIGLNVPYNSPQLINNSGGTASASPWVITIRTAGIKGLPSVINAIILVSAWSAGNSDLYASSRTLYALAIEGQLPRFLRRCTKDGLPVWAVFVTSLFGVLGYMNAGSATAVTVFNWLYNISSITGLISWLVILVAYLRMYYGLKRQGLSRDEFPYIAPFQPYASWFGAIFVSLVIFFNGFTIFLAGNWDVSSFVAAYICLPIFGLLWGGWKLFKGSRWVTLDEMDFVTGRSELEKMDAEQSALYKPPQGFWARLWDWLF
ncbi:amino acid permease/ SLC12A domain-containing protein [Rhizoctonia solani]|nr:amino acid permease/ SLC12A domain-containing protein [Rhizoctonia solani]